MSDNDYNTLREQNISERNAMFSELFKDIKRQTSEINAAEKKRETGEDTENQPPKKRRKTSSRHSQDSYRNYKTHLEFRKNYNTRSKKKVYTTNDPTDSENEDHDSLEHKSNRPKLKVLFPWAKPFQRSIDLMKMGVCDVDEEQQESDEDNDIFTDSIANKRVYKVTSEYDPDNIPSVDEITENMIDNIAEKSSVKTYCKINGTSCHQCRQKTLDTKTVCRSGECIGVRGQFCGPCLRGRYGESAVEALKDPNWACPPCRGLCNCSICRTRSGLRPTGILAPVAQEEGFSSVMDYLQAAEVADIE